MKKQMETGKKKAPEDEWVPFDPADPEYKDKVKKKVRLKAPKQKNNKPVYYTVGGQVDVNALPDPDGNFKPGRFVINIVVDNDPDVVIDAFIEAEPDPLAPPVFDPAVILEIEVTDEDIRYAAPKKIKLAYHNGVKWVVKQEDIDQAGKYPFMLKKVGDPAIGMSP
jgi:hypothetical protein